MLIIKHVQKALQNITPKLITVIALVFVFGSAVMKTKTVNAQSNEFGFLLGGSYYLGDLNPYRHFKDVNPAGGIFMRYAPNDRLAWRAHFLYGRVEGSDSSAAIGSLRERNLHFRSPVVEFGGQFEINFVEYEIGNKKKPFTPYMFVGLSFFYMNPQAQLDGVWYDLQPLGTEGQGIEGNSNNYSRNQISMPFGLGIKWNVGRRLAIGLEYGLRRTWTDYLDDVSGIYFNNALIAQNNGEIAALLADRSPLNRGINGTNEGMRRGDDSRNDWYSFFGVTISWRLGDVLSECPRWR
ncbi:MAG: type IX secretion system protein PorG [Luteibaculaceae bacterium]